MTPEDAVRLQAARLYTACASASDKLFHPFQLRGRERAKALADRFRANAFADAAAFYRFPTMENLGPWEGLFNDYPPEEVWTGYEPPSVRFACSCRTLTRIALTAINPVAAPPYFQIEYRRDGMSVALMTGRASGEPIVFISALGCTGPLNRGVAGLVVLDDALEGAFTSALHGRIREGEDRVIFVFESEKLIDSARILIARMEEHRLAAKRAAKEQAYTELQEK